MVSRFYMPPFFQDYQNEATVSPVLANRTLQKFVRRWRRRRWENYGIDQLNEHDWRDLGINPEEWRKYHDRRSSF